MSEFANAAVASAEKKRRDPNAPKGALTAYIIFRSAAGNSIAHHQRCADHPQTHSSAAWSGAVQAHLQASPQIDAAAAQIYALAGYSLLAV